MLASIGKKISYAAPATGKAVFHFIAPTTGDVLPLSDLTHPLVASGLLGTGAAIVMTTGEVLAPINCIVDNIAIDKAQLTLVSPNGLKILLQIGQPGEIEFGERIQWQVQKGDKCKQGTVLIKTDPLWIKQKGALPVCIITVINGAKLNAFVLTTAAKVRAAETGFLTLYI